MKKTLPSTLPVKRNIHFAEMFRSQQPLRVGWIWSALVLAGVGGWLPSANGQTPTVWSGGPGNWSTIANWSGGFVPNNGNGGQNWSAFIDSGNAANSVVQLDVSSSISQLHISAGDTLNILDNRSLSIVGGVVNNNGTISLAWGGNPTFLAFNGSTSIAGTGSIDMTGGSFITGSGMLTNGVGHTIRGSGNLGSNSIFVINQGTVEAGTGFSMLIDPQNTGAGTVAFNNQGTVRAIGGGVVTLTGNGAGEFWGSGTYQATGAGSRIDLVGDVVVRNTTMAASAGGEIRGVGGNNQTLDNVTLSGNFVRADNGETRLLNMINNSGSMTANFGGNATGFRLVGNTSLTGGGSVNLVGGGGTIAGSSQFLTNVDNTISGSGNLGANSISVVNQGVVEAGAGGFAMLIDPQNNGAGVVAFDNQGIVRATGNGVVTLTGSGAGEFWGSGIYQANGVGARLDLVGEVVIRNTTLAALGGGEIRAVGGNNQTLDNVTLSGNFVRADNGATTLFNSISNSGTMSLNWGGNATAIRVSGNVSLSGGGSINMLGGGGTIDGAGALTNVNNTISGSGNLGANSISVVNQGTVEAGVGFAMTVDPVNLGGGNAAFTNSGVVRANGGLINMTGSGAGEFAGAGTFEALNAGTLQFDGNAVVQNVTGGVLNSGTWRSVSNVGTSRIRMLNDATSFITTIGTQAAVELSGADSQFFVRSTDTPLDNTLNLVQGSFTLRNGRNFATSSQMDNFGSIFLHGNATVLAVNGNFQQSGGSTILNNMATLDLNGANNSINGGVLGGNGNVFGDLTLGAACQLDPGLSPGQLNFSNNLTWTAGANIKFDLGLNAANSDFVSIAGNLLKSGAGSFNFTFVNNGWILGQTYDLIGFNSTGFSIGDFSYTNGGQFGGSFAFSGGNLLQFTLTSIPEPSAMLVLWGGLGAMLSVRRRKVA